jgi:DNA (cytosine-5)-methyltransferase 1
MIPIVDLFAGPGGLGEGFSSLRDDEGNQAFKIVLSIEKDPIAHKTLKLRSFFRQFSNSKRRVPDDYYDYLRGDLSLDELYSRHPEDSAKADLEAWNAELGADRRFPKAKIDERIRQGLNGVKDWVLIGGPPCQAYSLAGRSRMKGMKTDKRHFLYKAYLRILAEHRPAVFVLENVKGLLSSRVRGESIIDLIFSDLSHPVPAAEDTGASGNAPLEYKIFPLADYDESPGLFSSPRELDSTNFIIRAERHRIPQARHRLILVGVRTDLLTDDVGFQPMKLRKYREEAKMWNAIKDLPKLRSRLSKAEDSGQNWASTVRSLAENDALKNSGVEAAVLSAIRSNAQRVKESLPSGNDFMRSNKLPQFQAEWYFDARLKGICNHSSRSHMESDLWRYFFSACYAAVKKKSPKLANFPSFLLPNHKNVIGVDEDKVIFSDRFRVQVRSKPATTITSHIGKDGHYFIHPDPLQCRSLTVREAARLQTFPDNYYFVGPVTAKYQQVGNAVPPLLARQIAKVIWEAFCSLRINGGKN